MMLSCRVRLRVIAISKVMSPSIVATRLQQNGFPAGWCGQRAVKVADINGFGKADELIPRTDDNSCEARLRAHAGAVEGVLSDHLSEAKLTTRGVPQRLADAMRHAVLGGGKRFRPFLVLEAVQLFDVPRPVALETAAAVELVHCYSLVHDDLPAMDNDRLRRGLPTVWAAFDEWTAILAGNGLMTLAFEFLASERLAIGPGSRLELITGLAAAAGPAGMLGGQQLDLDAGKRNAPALPTASFVELLQHMKTGALLAFSAEAGAILAEAGSADREALRSYGRALGLAFQIADDLLDVEGATSATGKSVAKDAAAGKATLVAVLGPDGARQRLDELRQEAIGALSRFGGKAEMLRAGADFAARRTY